MKNEILEYINTEIWAMSVLTTIVFLILRLVGVTHWHWFWVFSPFPVSLIASFILAIISLIITSKKEKENEKTNQTRSI